MNVVAENTMTSTGYILFNKTVEEARRLGARGGKALGRNNRARRARMPPTTSASDLAQPVHLEPTAVAISRLDAQFYWLRGAEKRVRPNQPSLADSGLPSS
jgi:hypothetical protein